MLSGFFSILRKERLSDEFIQENAPKVKEIEEDDDGEMYTREQQLAAQEATRRDYEKRRKKTDKKIRSSPEWKEKQRRIKEAEEWRKENPPKALSIFDTEDGKPWTPTTTPPTKDAKARFPKPKPTASADKEQVDKEIERKMAIAEKELARYPKGEEFYRNKIAELQLHFAEMSEMDAPEITEAQKKKEKIQAETLEESEAYQKTKKNFLDSWIASEEKKLTDPKWGGKYEERRKDAPKWHGRKKIRESQHKEQEWGSANPRHRTEKEKILQEKRKKFVFSEKEEDDVTYTVTRQLPAGIDYKPKKDYVGTKVPEETVEEIVSSRSLYKKVKAWFENHKARRIEVIDNAILDGIERYRRKAGRKGARGFFPRDKSFKQNVKKLKQLKKYSYIVDKFAEYKALKGRWIPPEKTDSPKEETPEKSYYDWLRHYVIGSAELAKLKQARKDLQKHGITLDEVKSTWEGVKTHHRTLIRKIKTLQKQTVMLGEYGDSGEELKRLQKVLEEAMAQANKNRMGEGRSKSLASRPNPEILREMLLAKAKGDQYEPAYKILIQSYLKGGKLESYLNAIKRIREKWQPPEGKHQLVDLKLSREEKQLLYDTTYGDGRQGWRILAEILKEKGIHVPKAYSANLTDVWSKIESGGSQIKQLSSDMRELERVLDSEDYQDDVDYITGEDSRQHIQSLLYVTERNYKNMKEGEEKDKLGIFYGKLAYLGKFINENREEGDESPQIKVSNQMLKDQNMSYHTLDEHFASLLSERVKTILENPENWGTLLASKEERYKEELKRRQEESAQRYRERVGTVEDWIEDMRQNVGTETYVDKETGEEKPLYRFQTKEEAEKRIKEFTDALERNKDKKAFDWLKQHFGAYDFDFMDLPLQALLDDDVFREWGDTLSPDTVETLEDWVDEYVAAPNLKDKQFEELRERMAGQPAKILHDGKWITREQYKEETGKEWESPFQASPRPDKDKKYPRDLSVDPSKWRIPGRKREGSE